GRRAGHLALVAGARPPRVPARAAGGGRRADPLALPREAEPMSRPTSGPMSGPTTRSTGEAATVERGRAPLLRLPPVAGSAGRARMLVLRPAVAYRRAWLAFVSGFFEPVFYLLALGQGLGALVGTLPGPDGRPISYSAFIAPGLLAASAMYGAVYDATFN